MNNGKICVAVCAETADEMIENIKRAEEFADVIEVRFDCLRPEQIEDLSAKIERSIFAKLLLATFRSPEQGGKSAATIDERTAFWQRPWTRFWAADVEEDVFDVSPGWNNRIVSYHDFDNIPTDLESIYNRLISHDADITKIAVQTDDITDAIPVWKLIEKAKAAGKEVIPIAMGEAGKWTRILGLAHGAFMTYTSLDAGKETAEGQITVKEMINVYRVRELDENTQVFGVIGDPISQSVSPYMHNPAFAAAGINAVFIPLLVKNLDEFMRRMVVSETREVELNFCGFSVTMPHKQAIMKYLDAIDPTAEKIGAVNTVKIEDGKLTGYNTDAHGFITPLKTRFGSLQNASVAVFGAGGAARACVYALTQEGADVTVFARDHEKGKAFANEFDVNFEKLPTANCQLPTATDIVVNATPLGMKGPYENETLFTSDELSGVKFVYDLVTRPDDTPLINEAKKAGIPVIGGVEMLIAQGARQFEIWTGRAADIETMRDSLISRMQV